VLDEIESNTANSTFVQPMQLVRRDAILDAGHPAIGVVAGGDGVQCDGHVGAMAAGVNNDGAGDADFCVQLAQAFDRRVRWRVASIGGIRKFARRPKHMAVGIAGTRRQSQRRRNGIRVRRQTTLQGIDRGGVHLWASLSHAASSAKYFSPALARDSRIP